MNNYKTLLTVILDICLIKKGPQHMPESVGLLKVMAFTYFVSGSLLLSSEVSWFDATMQALIETLLLGFFVYGLVRFFSVAHRFNQAMTATYASGALITTLSVPFVFLVASLPINEKLIGVLGLVFFWVVCWSFIVMANIIRETIGKNLWVSMLLTFCYIYLSYRVVSFIYPADHL